MKALFFSHYYLFIIGYFAQSQYSYLPGFTFLDIRDLIRVVRI